MKKSHRAQVLILTVCMCTIVSSGCADVWQQYKLWYSQPASEWLQALPVGNGRLGAMVFGGTITERIQLNDDTIWAGPPVPEAVPGFAEAMDKARALWFDGKYVEAESMVASVMGPRISPRSYQTLGDLHLQLLNVPENAVHSKYLRQLSLDRAEAVTRFTIDGVTYSRSVFCSEPDQVIVVRMTADKPGKLSLQVSLDRPADFTTEAGQGTLDMYGQAQHGGKHLGVKWHCRLQTMIEGSRGGSIQFEKMCCASKMRIPPHSLLHHLLTTTRMTPMLP